MDRSALWDMPFEERAAMLILSFVKEKRETVSIMTGLMGLQAHMANYLDESDCMRCAEALRDLADQVEHRRSR